MGRELTIRVEGGAEFDQALQELDTLGSEPQATGVEPGDAFDSALAELGGIEAPEAVDPAKEQAAAALLAQPRPPSKLQQAKTLVEKHRRSVLQDGLMGINAAIADTLDLPGTVAAGATNMISRALGLRELPSGGFRKMFAEFGWAPDVDQEPETTAFHAGKVTGGGLAFLPMAPLGVGAQVAAPARAAIGETIKLGAKRAARGIGEAAVRAPGTFAVAETVSSAAAGLGFAAVSGNVPEDGISLGALGTLDKPTAEFLGTMAGGMAPTVLPTRLAYNAAKSVRKRISDPLKPKGASKRVRERISRTVEDIEASKSRLEDPNLLPEIEELATPAQISRDPGLLEIEKAIVKNSDDVIQLQHNQNIEDMNRIIFESLSAPDDAVEVTRRTLDQEREYVKSLVRTRMEQAARIVQERLGKLSPKTDKKIVNQMVFDEMSDAEKVIRATEDQLWDMVPTTAKAEASATLSTWNKHLSDRVAEADVSELLLTHTSPGDSLLKFLGRRERGQFKAGLWRKKPITVKNLQTLRSRVLLEIRKLRAERGSRNKIRILDDLQSAMLADLEAADAAVDSLTGPALPAALAYSRQANQQLNKGVVGKILGVDKTGAERIHPALTLETALSGKSAKAAENLDDILKAVEGPLTPAGVPDFNLDSRKVVINAVEDFVKHNLFTGQGKAFRNGVFDPVRAQEFLEKNGAVLKRLPQLRKEIEEAIVSGNVESLRKRRFETISKQFEDHKISKATMFLKKDPALVFKELESLRPAVRKKELANLIKQVSRDKTGEAREGLEAAFLANLLERSKVRGLVDSGNLPLVSGFKLQTIQEKEGVQDIIAQLFTKEKQERLKLITNSARMIELSKSAKPSAEGVLGKSGPHPVIEILAKMSGAHSGSVIAKGTGTGGIQMQAIMSAAMLKKVRKAIKDPAMIALHKAFMSDDPTFLKNLLADLDDMSAGEIEILGRQLNGWLVNALYERGESLITDEEEQ